MTQDIQEQVAEPVQTVSQKLESWLDIPSTAPQYGSDLVVIGHLFWCLLSLQI
jgi:hypothetical protein